MHRSGVSFQTTPSSQPLTGIRPGETTKNRDKDIKSTNISYKLNQSQLLSGKGSNRSQPKSGNDSQFEIGLKGSLCVGISIQIPCRMVCKVSKCRGFVLSGDKTAGERIRNAVIRTFGRGAGGAGDRPGNRPGNRTLRPSRRPRDRPDNRARQPSRRPGVKPKSWLSGERLFPSRKIAEAKRRKAL